MPVSLSILFFLHHCCCEKLQFLRTGEVRLLLLTSLNPTVTYTCSSISSCTVLCCVGLVQKQRPEKPIGPTEEDMQVYSHLKITKTNKTKKN